MTHPPQKYITRPHLVKALFYDGSAQGREALAEFLGTHCRAGAGGYAICRGLEIPADFWVVESGSDIKVLGKSKFEAQYSPFREELKDYPVEIINP